VHTLVLVIMIAMFAIVAVFLFYKWATPSVVEATAISCEFKKLSYCADWKTNAYGDAPWSWGDKPPAGCESFGVARPLAKDECNV
jgi:hypothetical protein